MLYLSWDDADLSPAYIVAITTALFDVNSGLEWLACNGHSGGGKMKPLGEEGNSIKITLLSMESPT